MKQTLNFNINIPELGDTPDITQISDAIQDMEDALAGTVEFMSASVSGTEITLSSPTRITNRIRYYEGMAIKFTSDVQINANHILTVKIDSLPIQLLSIPFLVTAGDTITIVYDNSSFIAKYSAIPRSVEIDSTSVVTVATSSALKAVNDYAKTKEDIIIKNTGFNLGKSDSVTSTSSIFLATSKAVKTVWDSVQSSLSSLSVHISDILNPHNVTKSQVGLSNVPNYTITSSVADSSSDKFGSADGVKTAYDKGLEALGLANTNKNAIQNNTEQIEILTTPSFEVMPYNGTLIRIGSLRVLVFRNALLPVYGTVLFTLAVGDRPKIETGIQVGGGLVATVGTVVQVAEIFVKEDGAVEGYPTAVAGNITFSGNVIWAV